MKTNSFYLLALTGGAVLFWLAGPQPISGQDAVQPPPPVIAKVEVNAADLPPQVVALINELTAQNKQLTTNQAAMDARIDEITESIRQARLFAARSGGAR